MKVPFVRIIIPMIAGILLQWEFRADIILWWCLLLVALLAWIFFPRLLKNPTSLFNPVKASFLNSLLFLSVGALLLFYHDIRNNRNWYAAAISGKEYFVVMIRDPPQEKEKTFKLVGHVQFIIEENKCRIAKGGVLVYLSKKNLSSRMPRPGDRILFRKRIDPVSKIGNPGTFDYRRWALFNGITGQVFLEEKDYFIENRSASFYDKTINSSKNHLLGIIQKYIPGNKESGLAEALLLGYRDHLEKDLVQSYSRTGVVHIIAISGLHLGIIYWLLQWIFSPLKRIRRSKWIRAVLIIAGIWTFSILCGAQPSVLRSALMFTCIILGQAFGRRANIYNSLAASAFLLLCINPFWLWDIGFQLSYMAVLSLVIFMQPIYRSYYIKNKILDQVWKLIAVTLSAQILTTPLCLYHFHQFPAYFILSNLVAVPLSSLILLVEIAICALSVFPLIASALGNAAYFLIYIMNYCIETIEKLPGSLWEHICVSAIQVILLYLCACLLFLGRQIGSTRAVFASLVSLLIFVCIRSISHISAERTNRVIIYNLPGKPGMDLAAGGRYFFVGDPQVHDSTSLKNFYVEPTRTLFRMTGSRKTDTLPNNERLIQFQGKHIFYLNRTFRSKPGNKKPIIDILVMSGKQNQNLAELCHNLFVRQVVLDASVPWWKAAGLNKCADSLRVPVHNVATQGAFVMSWR